MKNIFFYLILLLSYMLSSCTQSDFYSENTSGKSNNLTLSTNDLAFTSIAHNKIKIDTLSISKTKDIPETTNILEVEMMNGMNQDFFIWEKPYGQEVTIPFDENNYERIYSINIEQNKTYRIRCNNLIQGDYGIGFNFFKNGSHMNITRVTSSSPDNISIFYSNGMANIYQWVLFINQPAPVWNNENNIDITFYFQDGSTTIFEVGNYEH